MVSKCGILFSNNALILVLINLAERESFACPLVRPACALASRRFAEKAFDERSATALLTGIRSDSSSSRRGRVVSHR